MTSMFNRAEREVIWSRQIVVNKKLASADALVSVTLTGAQVTFDGRQWFVAVDRSIGEDDEASLWRFEEFYGELLAAEILSEEAIEELVAEGADRPSS